MALGAELADDDMEDKHKDTNGSATYHDHRCVCVHFYTTFTQTSPKIFKDNTLSIYENIMKILREL